MSRRPNTLATWFADFHKTPWMKQGPCGRKPHYPWTDDLRPDPTLVRSMAAVCQECPVLRVCADFAVNANNGAGVDGGFYAGVWIPWQSSDPLNRHREGRRLARLYLRRTARGKRIGVTDESSVHSH